MALLVELESTKKGVNQLEANVKSENDTVVELWQENCNQ